MTCDELTLPVSWKFELSPQQSTRPLLAWTAQECDVPVVTDLYRLPVRTSCALVDEGIPSGAPSSPKKLPPQQNTSCAEETAQVCVRFVSIETKLAGTPRSLKASV